MADPGQIQLTLDTDEIADIDHLAESGVGLLAQIIPLNRALDATLEILQIKETQFAEITAADEAAAHPHPGGTWFESRCLFEGVGALPALRIGLETLFAQLLDLVDLDLSNPILSHGPP